MKILVIAVAVVGLTACGDDSAEFSDVASQVEQMAKGGKGGGDKPCRKNCDEPMPEPEPDPDPECHPELYDVCVGMCPTNCIGQCGEPWTSQAANDCYQACMPSCEEWCLDLHPCAAG